MSNLQRDFVYESLLTGLRKAMYLYILIYTGFRSKVQIFTYSMHTLPIELFYPLAAHSHFQRDKNAVNSLAAGKHNKQQFRAEGEAYYKQKESELEKEFKIRCNLITQLEFVLTELGFFVVEKNFQIFYYQSKQTILFQSFPMFLSLLKRTEQYKLSVSVRMPCQHIGMITLLTVWHSHAEPWF